MRATLALLALCQQISGATALGCDATYLVEAEAGNPAAQNLLACCY